MKHLQKKDWLIHCPVRVLPVPRVINQNTLQDHDFNELVVITAGKAVNRCGSRSFTVTGGDVFEIPANAAHYYKSVRKLSLVNILHDLRLKDFKKEHQNDYLKYQKLFRLPQPLPRKFLPVRFAPWDMPVVLRFIEQLKQYRSAGGRGGDYQPIYLFVELIRTLILLCEQRAVPKIRATDATINKTKLLLETSFRDHFTIEHLRAVSGLSRATLFRNFRKQVGMTPIDYLINVRIRKAQEMLATQPLDITEIAWRCGFSDSNYFAKQFRKITGLAPRQYRQNRTRIIA